MAQQTVSGTDAQTGHTVHSQLTQVSQYSQVLSVPGPWVPPLAPFNCVKSRLVTVLFLKSNFFLIFSVFIIFLLYSYFFPLAAAAGADITHSNKIMNAVRSFFNGKLVSFLRMRKNTHPLPPEKNLFIYTVLCYNLPNETS